MSADATLVYNNLVAILSLIALVAAVSLTTFRMMRGPEAGAILGDKGIWLAWVVATAATVGSLIYSEVIHFEPCRLCWFQRIAMYPLSVILLVGAIRRDWKVKYYALPLALIGFAVSVWHYIIQTFPSLEGGSCDVSNPCSSKYVNVFDFISIPFMAGTGFIVIAVLLGIYVNKNSFQEETRPVE